MCIINVDFDGVLATNTHEDRLICKVKDEGYSFNDLSPIWDWYDKLVNTVMLPINTMLMNYLAQLRNEGHSIRLWTNRSYTLRCATERNLGVYTHIFDDMLFYAGQKHFSTVEGVVIDNDYKNLSCGQAWFHYSWNQGQQALPYKVAFS